MEIINPDYARVTEVLSIFQAYAYVDRAKLKKAQDLGSDVHDAIECFWRGEFTPLSNKHNPYFQSFLKWIEGKEILPIEIEKRFKDESLKVTGKLDLVCEYNGLTVILDYKTGSWAHPEIWRLQGTFYRMLLQASGWKYLPSHFLFLQLKPDGNEPNEFAFEFDPAHIDVCKAALHCYNYFKQKNPLPG